MDGHVDERSATSLTLSATLRALHKERRRDRIAHLRSIDHDANFVALAHAALGAPPAFANLPSLRRVEISTCLSRPRAVVGASL